MRVKVHTIELFSELGCYRVRLDMVRVQRYTIGHVTRGSILAAGVTILEYKLVVL